MQVNFLTKLVALKPGDTVQEMIKNVMLGKDEGADNDGSDEASARKKPSGIAGRVGFIPNEYFFFFLRVEIYHPNSRRLCIHNSYGLFFDDDVMIPRVVLLEGNLFLCALACFLRL